MKIRDILLCDAVVDLSPQNPASPEELAAVRRDKIARYKALALKIKPLADKEYLTPREAYRYRKLNDEAIELRFDITRPLTPDKVAVNDMNTMTPEVVLAAHADMHKNRAVYRALMSAAAGASYDEDTAVDDVMNGRNDEVSAYDFYRQFDATRAALAAQWGDTVPLFRAEGRQKPKATTNWATTQAFAQQFGPRVVQRDIPLANILAVNIAGGGRYHELIVGNPPPPPAAQPIV